MANLIDYAVKGGLYDECHVFNEVYFLHPMCPITESVTLLEMGAFKWMRLYVG